MRTSESNWRLPRDWVFLLSVMALPAVCLFAAAFLLRFVHGTRQGDPTFVRLSLVLAAVGVALLFIARLPLYRQGRYFTFGSKALPPGYRKVYRVAYAFLGVAVAMMLGLLAVLR